MIASSTTAVAILAMLVTLLAPGRPAHAAEITIVTSRAMAPVLEGGLGAEFEEATGHKLRVVTGYSPEFVKRIHTGEPFDIVVAPSPVIDRLAESGRIMSH
jgi:ABC-type molybdate transport system substrate-binding protein